MEIRDASTPHRAATRFRPGNQLAVPVLTIHENGIAHITLFMGNAGQRSAEDLMNFVESFEELRVDVELNNEHKEKLSQIKGGARQGLPK